MNVKMGLQQNLLKDPPRKVYTKDTFHISNSVLVYGVNIHVHFNFRKEDSLPTRDKIAGPKVSSIQRFHCNVMMCLRVHVHVVQYYMYLSLIIRNSELEKLCIIRTPFLVPVQINNICNKATSIRRSP